MIPLRRRWAVPATNPKHDGLLGDALIDAMGVPREVLRPQKQGVTPFWGLHDMEKGVATIQQLIAEKRRVAVFGDYDLDGMSGTTILIRALQPVLDVFPYIPEREDGFGLNNKAIEAMHRMGAGAIITVDNGSDRADIVADAHQKGMIVGITDHHIIPRERMAPAEFLINPGVEGSVFSQPLCGAGVAFALAACCAERKIIPSVIPLVAFACLGTVADVVDLLDVNRNLVLAGLPYLEHFPGIQALMRESRVAVASAKRIAFNIAPRLNAPGRIERAQTSLRLLLTDDPQEAAVLAKKLQRVNSERRRLTKEMEAQAHALVAQLPEENCSIFLAQEEWKHGIVGLVAARMSETYNRPSFVGAIEVEKDDAGNLTGKKIVRGSARSNALAPDGSKISCYELLKRCRVVEPAPEEVESEKDLLGKGGGHAAAAGFVLPLENMDEFSRELEKAARELMGKPPVDIALGISMEWPVPSKYDLRSMAQLEPTGAGFPSPHLLSRKVTVDRVLDRYQESVTVLVKKRGRSPEGKEEMIKARAKFFSGGPKIEKGTVLDMVYHVDGIDLNVDDFSVNSL